MCRRMLVSIWLIPVYPGLGLKLGSRRGIATDLICGRGDWVRLEAPVGGGRCCGRGRFDFPARASQHGGCAASSALQHAACGSLSAIQLVS